MIREVQTLTRMPMTPIPLTCAEDALALLTTLGAVPHLVQHHRLVSEAAVELCVGLNAAGFHDFDSTEVCLLYTSPSPRD